MKVRVTHHNLCSHESESWNLALSAALSHAEVTMDPRSRQPVIRLLMSDPQGVWHQGVHFTGRLVS